MDKSILQTKWDNAEQALKDLEDEWLIQNGSHWKPVWGLLRGCLEQLQDAREEACIDE